MIRIGEPGVPPVPRGEKPGDKRRREEAEREKKRKKEKKEKGKKPPKRRPPGMGEHVDIDV